MSRKVLYVLLVILSSSLVLVAHQIFSVTDEAKEEQVIAESSEGYQEGLLDRVLSREKTAPKNEPAAEHETFEDRLRKEKGKQRIEDIGTKREGTPAKVLKDLLY